MLDFPTGGASRTPVPSLDEPKTFYDTQLTLSLLHLPSTILRRTIRFSLDYLHLTVSLAVFCLALGISRLVPLIILGRSSHPGFPESRALFVALLFALPLWASSMYSFYLLWIFGKPVWEHLRDWRYGLGGYSPIGVVFDADADVVVRRRPSTPSRKTPRVTKYSALLLFYSALALAGLYVLGTYEQPLDHRFKSVVELANRVHKRGGYYGKGEKIFIAAMFHNNAAVIPHWTSEMTKAIHYFGPDNVFISIVESYSDDASGALLREFDNKLEAMRVPHLILTNETSIPQPITSETDTHRINFLAAVRNLAIEPLVANGGYDRLLFSNDIFVQAESVVELLHTKEGEYDMACGTDFQHWGLYDLWVIRDRLGRLVSALWPYFLEDAGFRAIMADKPAPVFACWNGIASIRAEPFLPPSMRRAGLLSTAPRAHPLPPSHPLAARLSTNTSSPATAPPLRFRASAPSECFSSESFLLPYDLRRVFALDGMYVNPRVITAYRWKYYLWFKYILRHWAVKWFVERVERGNGIHLAKHVLGDPAQIWQWDGGECNPGPW
ncbi:cryptococcal mannosyltransferase 1-domain-containing protein [Mycena metata]|uniref:Cryptococcal mannosyltransferase 1-domain-containing protein n=1 Tax=Mycena metata TaxID=1033252 RepID=A0AAD7NLN7_9AGAR|nr:cryptococcal mannosyltransferase 1-domain-containing protein [Mycena metata]